MELAHLTDVHLGPVSKPKLYELFSKRFFGYLSWQRRRHLMHRVELLDAIRHDLHSNPPDHIAISGDLVNISLPSEFVRAHEWLTRLGNADDISVIPGNHDAYAGRAYLQGWKLWNEYTRSDGEEHTVFPTVRRRPGLTLIGLASAVPSPIGFAYGRLGVDQLQGLAKILSSERETDTIRVVQLHHPPLFSGKRRCLRNSAEFQAVIAEHGAELVIAGHEHHFQIGMINGPDRPVPVVAGPSASLMRFDGPYAGGYIRYQLPERRGDTIRLSRYVFAPDDKRVVVTESGALSKEDGHAVLRG